MKLIETSNGWVLDEIKQARRAQDSDIRLKNLAAAESDPKYKPESILLIWIDDEEIRDVLTNEFGFLLKPVERDVKDENGDVVGVTTRYSLKFKAYPRIRTNFRTGMEEVYPRVMLKTKKNDRLDIDHFGLIDTCTLSNLAIKFHAYENPYDSTKPSVAVIDELWAVSDQSAGVVDDEYLEEKYGDHDDEEMPFE